MARHKHKPQRTCIACRERKYKQDLVRIVRTPTGEIIVDRPGKANGRGLYLCQNPDCWAKGLQPERLTHALRLSLSSKEMTVLSEKLYTELSNG